MRRQDKKRYASNVKRCRICDESKAIDNHHIIPKADGGSDFGTNRVWLCPNCHRKVHKGIFKIYGYKDLGYKLELDYEIVNETN